MFTCVGKYHKCLSKPLKKIGLCCVKENKGVLAIKRIFSLVDMITKPKFSNYHTVFKIGLFR